MVIGIQNGLVMLKQQLRFMGYDVVDLERVKSGVDAVIYSGKLPDFSHASQGAVMAVNSNGYPGYVRGTLLINASGLSAEEIDRILKRKLYSPLF